ncbi:hypothetical protein RhiirC2_779260 [Rhizophagus irregularis]|uniref:Uncharacterized protein n=1 Tax=Rhizophagus irregularis TaxID=588596 RepID=A0A2N1NA45_9GLOM|nr:hypothetical protein RhiirC2_779260 [Rhizophagus irregularis]
MKEKFESHCQLKKCQFILFGILDLQYTEIIDTEETHKVEVEDEAEADRELQESEKRRGRRNRRRRRRRKLL